MRLPSVTTVLKYYQDFSRVPEDVLQAACERGSKVHAACAATALGVWCPALPEELQGYHLSFMMWLDCYVDEVVLVEPELVSAALGYCGHPDLLVRIMGDKGLAIVDLKTPAGLVKTWALQCAAYRRLALADYHDVHRNLSLRLRQDGSPALVQEYSGNYSFDLGVFMNALSVHRYLNG